VAKDLSEGPRRLSDLRRGNVADASLENLLTTLSAKITACTRLAVFEYEAGSDGHPALAAAFRDLAATERRSFDALLDCLHRHLAEMRADQAFGAAVDDPTATKQQAARLRGPA
jgi:hypothetical protein